MKALALAGNGTNKNPTTPCTGEKNELELMVGRLGSQMPAPSNDCLSAGLLRYTCALRGDINNFQLRPSCVEDGAASQHCHNSVEEFRMERKQNYDRVPTGQHSMFNFGLY